MGTTRKIKDVLRQTLTYGSGVLLVAVLSLIFVYVFSNGASLLSWDLLSGDYASSTLTYSSANAQSGNYAYPSEAKGFYSPHWGIAFADTTSLSGESEIGIVYLDPISPIAKLSNDVQVGEYFTKAFLEDTNGTMLLALAKSGAEEVTATFEKATKLTSFSLTTKGGGIRGALLSTLLVIGVSLALALPLGIGAAVYFVYFAPGKNKAVAFLERMIEITSGIPSIIFGLIGVAVFIPLVSALSGVHSGSLLSGSLTLVIILLPTIMKTSEEALREVPLVYRNNALALGASERQCLYRIVLPTAFPGLLSSAILATGRIIGESAALVYAVGTFISDSVSLTGKSATLAVEIWSLLSGENPNYRLASAIALLILILVSLLSLSAKLISLPLLKKRGLS